MNITNTNTSFKARCVQVRDADWVCRAINHTLPHHSTTKHQARIIDYLERNKSIIKFDKTPTNQTEVYEILLNTKLPSKYNNIQKFLNGIKYSLEKLADNRLKAEVIMKGERLFQSLFMTEMYKTGNCTENAIIAELILKMNNINNACCAAIYKGTKNAPQKDWIDIDHAVCVFNIDGTPFSEKITKNTIIIDPWAGKAGFAKDMEKFYRDELSKYFKIQDNEVFKYERASMVNIPDYIMAKLKDKYKPFIFTNKNRKFMKTANNNK